MTKTPAISYEISIRSDSFGFVEKSSGMSSLDVSRDGSISRLTLKKIPIDNFKWIFFTIDEIDTFLIWSQSDHHLISRLDISNLFTCVQCSTSFETIFKVSFPKVQQSRA